MWLWQNLPDFLFLFLRKKLFIILLLLLYAILFRADLGHYGSFGGKSTRHENLIHQPVVFVHGVSDRAHDKALAAATHF